MKGNISTLDRDDPLVLCVLRKERTANTVTLVGTVVW